MAVAVAVAVCMTMAAVVTVTVATVIVPVVVSVSVRCLPIVTTAGDVTRFVCRVWARGHCGAPLTQLAQRPRRVRSWCCTSKPAGARWFIGPGQAWIGNTRSHATQ